MALGARIHRTDQEGMLLVTLVEAGVEVWHERAPPPGGGPTRTASPSGRRVGGAG
jgi:hypothetical protein